MRRTVIVIALLLMAASGFAADKDPGKSPLKSPKAETSKEGSSQKSVKEKKTPQWPRPYKSREEISVDSTVPFPTDI